MLTAPGISIDWQELYAILVACSISGASWSQKRIIFWCDNQPVVHMLNTKRSKEPKIMVLIRELTLLTMQYNFYSWHQRPMYPQRKSLDTFCYFRARPAAIPGCIFGILHPQHMLFWQEAIHKILPTVPGPQFSITVPSSRGDTHRPCSAPGKNCESRYYQNISGCST